jgi:hypothetical protein
MTEAAFGVIGVLLGGILGGGASYFMTRRQSWSSARASALLMLEELALLDTALARWEVSDLPVWAEDLGVASWEEHRQALTFRKGYYPSGLNATEWLRLADTFVNLRVLHEWDANVRDEVWRERAIENFARAKALLLQFELDPPAFATFLSNLLRSARPRAHES